MCSQEISIDRHYIYRYLLTTPIYPYNYVCYWIFSSLLIYTYSCCRTWRKHLPVRAFSLLRVNIGIHFSVVNEHFASLRIAIVNTTIERAKYSIIVRETMSYYNRWSLTLVAVKIMNLSTHVSEMIVWHIFLYFKDKSGYKQGVTRVLSHFYRCFHRMVV